MFGIVAGGVASAVGTVAQAATGAVGSGAAAVLTGFADSITAACQKLDDEFDKIGKDLCDKERAKIVNAFNKVINEAEFKNCMDMCRWKFPWGKTEFDGCAKGKCCKNFMTTAGKIIVPELLAVDTVKELIKNSQLVSVWKTVIDIGVKASDKINELTKKERLPPIDLDIEEYIVKEFCEKLNELMQKREEQVRKKPQEMSRARPETFPLLFSGDKITEGHYDIFLDKK